MSHTVIPAPVRFDVDLGREFVFRPGTAVAYTDAGLAPIAQQFCSEITRRTGLRLAPRAGHPVPDEPAVTIELAAGDDHGELPASIGLSPAGDSAADERHSLLIDGDQVVVRAVNPVGVARGLTTLVQLLATAPSASTQEISVPGARILDAPRFAWRGLSLDLARASFTVGEIRRVIDLLALYKLNVLHVHLTDDQSWRLPVGRPTGIPEPDAAFYSDEDLRALASYAADRFITVVPEVDTPGHASALMHLHPELNTGCGPKMVSRTSAAPPWTGSRFTGLHGRQPPRPGPLAATHGDPRRPRHAQEYAPVGSRTLRPHRGPDYGALLDAALVW